MRSLAIPRPEGERAAWEPQVRCLDMIRWARRGKSAAATPLGTRQWPDSAGRCDAFCDGGPAPSRNASVTAHWPVGDDSVRGNQTDNADRADLDCRAALRTRDHNGSNRPDDPAAPHAFPAEMLIPARIDERAEERDPADANPREIRRLPRARLSNKKVLGYNLDVTHTLVLLDPCHWLRAGKRGFFYIDGRLAAPSRTIDSVFPSSPLSRQTFG